MTNWIAVLKPLWTLIVIASAARGFVAFVTWRESFRNRLLGAEPNPQEGG